eukprot:757371-Hanusia_phi.AAC.2
MVAEFDREEEERHGGLLAPGQFNLQPSLQLSRKEPQAITLSFLIQKLLSGRIFEDVTPPMSVDDTTLVRFLEDLQHLARQSPAPLTLNQPLVRLGQVRRRTRWQSTVWRTCKDGQPGSELVQMRKGKRRLESNRQMPSRSFSPCLVFDSKTNLFSPLHCHSLRVDGELRADEMGERFERMPSTT